MSTSYKAIILVQPQDGFGSGEIEVRKTYKGKEAQGPAAYRVDYPGKKQDQAGKGEFYLDGGVLNVDVGEWDFGGLEGPVAMSARLRGYKDVDGATGSGQLVWGGDDRLFQSVVWTVIGVIPPTEEHAAGKKPKKRKGRKAAKKPAKARR